MKRSVGKGQVHVVVVAVVVVVMIGQTPSPALEFYVLDKK